MRLERPPSSRKSWEELPGKSILIGVTIHDHQDKLLRHDQHHGRITSADERRGIVVALEGSDAGKTLCLPPDLRAIQKALPGAYRLRSTGEVLADPDLLARWVKKEAAPGRPEDNAALRSAVDRRLAWWAVPGISLILLIDVLEIFERSSPFRSVYRPLELIGYLLFLVAALRWLRLRSLHPFWAFLLANPGLRYFVPRDIRDEFYR